MARKRRGFLEEEDSDNTDSNDDFGFDSDPDDLDNPSRHKRRKTNNAESRSDWTKAPSFISGDKVSKMDVDAVAGLESSDSESSEDEEEENSDIEQEYSDSGEAEVPESPLPKPPDQQDEAPSIGLDARGGIGSKGGIGSASSFSKGGIGSSFSKGGLGSARNSSTASAFSKAANLTSTEDYTAREESPLPAPTPSNDLPTSFTNSASRAFVREDAPSPSPKPAVLNPREQAHFNKISGTFGARMLAKMGWETGTGLGAAGEGIVTPVESKMRPQKMGIAFKGFKEKTEQSKNEARRRGEAVSDDEDEKTKKARKKREKAKEKQSDLWKKPKKVKTTYVHKTYEDYVAEAGLDSASAGIGQIIDATGAVPKEVSSLADVSLDPWAPSNGSTRIPEIRHNVRLIADSCKSDLDGLAREGKSLDERKKFIIQEDNRLRKKVEDEADMISRLQQVQIVSNDINLKSKELGSMYEISFEQLSPLFYQLLEQFPREFQRYQLDEVVAAAIAPLLRRMVNSWNPLEDPTAFVTTFRGWKGALRFNSVDENAGLQVDKFGTERTIAPALIEKPMTPFESLLWNVWLPRVRTCINNEWSPYSPQPAVKLYDAWSTFLPPFIRDNLLDQLILPKIQKAVTEWTPQHDVSLSSVVFPWLPHVGLRLEEFVADARRKIKSLLRSWSVGSNIPADLLAWRDVFSKGDWDAMLLKYVVPKLGAALRNDFSVNPRDQKMEPLKSVLEWADIVRSSILIQILETDFFPKWLDVLYIWLIQPTVSYEEIAQWYSCWSREVFPEAIRRSSGMEKGFTRGQQLMNEAITLGPEAPNKLQRPDYKAELAAPTTPVRNGKPTKVAAAPRPSARTHEITFRSIVEEFAASHNLMFFPAGRTHEKSRMPLFRVSPTVDGRRGILIYILDDAVWAAPEGAGSESEDFIAVSLEDMVKRAA